MIHKLDNPLDQCNLKFASKGGAFEGFASKFDGNDAVNDTILKGAFEKTLADRARPPLMLFQHDSSKVIGKFTDMEETAEGLVVTGEFTPGHSLAKDVHASMKHGAIDGLSIGFRIPKGGAEAKDEDNPFSGRVIKEIDLVEVSVVSLPADAEARISVVKEEIEIIKDLREAELFLRDSGVFSKSTAIAFVSRIKKLARRDAEADIQDEIAELQAKLAEKSTRSLIDKIRKA